ncbi:dihydrofolate reductase [Hirsutella rhossiliensis]
MGRGRIDCYLDIASFYSYVAFVDLLNNLDKLAANGVQVEFHPVFLGGIMQSTGNRPPWMVKAKGAYLSWDSARAAHAVGITDWATPPRLLDMAKTMSPLRALLFIKANHPPPVLHAALLALFRRFWTPPHVFLGDDDNLAAALADAAGSSGGPGNGERLFAPDEVRRIMAGREAFRDALKAETDRALELGAFGAPWLWVTDGAGKAEPFFGSDRFAQIYQHLGIAHQDAKVLAPESKL